MKNNTQKMLLMIPKICDPSFMYTESWKCKK